MKLEGSETEAVEGDELEPAWIGLCGVKMERSEEFEWSGVLGAVFGWFVEVEESEGVTFLDELFEVEKFETSVSWNVSCEGCGVRWIGTR